jgi:outer membrane protein assembly factor BamB
LNAETGELVWKYTIEDQIRCMPSLIENRAFVAGCDSRLHVIDVDKGKSAGDVEIDGPTGVTPAADGDFVYFGTESGTFYAINWRTAEVAWRFQDDSSSLAFRSSAAVSGKYVVVGGRSKRVYALDAETGDTRWEFVTRRNVDSSPVIAGQRVYVGSADGRLYCLELETGKKVWEYETGGRLSAAPAIAAGRLIIASDDGVVYCFGKKVD